MYVYMYIYIFIHTQTHAHTCTVHIYTNHQHITSPRAPFRALLCSAHWRTIQTYPRIWACNNVNKPQVLHMHTRALCTRTLRVSSMRAQVLDRSQRGALTSTRTIGPSVLRRPTIIAYSMALLMAAQWRPAPLRRQLRQHPRGLHRPVSLIQPLSALEARALSEIMMHSLWVRLWCFHSQNGLRMFLQNSRTTIDGQFTVELNGRVHDEFHEFYECSHKCRCWSWELQWAGFCIKVCSYDTRERMQICIFSSVCLRRQWVYLFV